MEYQESKVFLEVTGEDGNVGGSSAVESDGWNCCSYRAPRRDKAGWQPKNTGETRMRTNPWTLWLRNNGQREDWKHLEILTTRMFKLPVDRKSNSDFSFRSAKF